ncbi:MAG TPA: hypothetical protein VFM54_09515 [Micromonosporaceae bacterium]|nr:hypothetical protein [Micromonosporaceae bacterium]
MLEQIMGLPTHVLLNHTAVVLVPLLAAAAACYALLPMLRPPLRWLSLALAVVAPLSALLAKLSGDAFFRALQGFEPPRIGGDMVARVQEHQQYGSILAWVSAGLGIATLLLVYVADQARRDAREGGAPAAGAVAGSLIESRGFTTALTVVTVGLAVASLVFIYLTGDSGARMVWDDILRDG